MAKTKQPIKIIIASVVGALMLGAGVHARTNAAAQITNDKAQITAIQQAVADTKKNNKILAQKAAKIKAEQKASIIDTPTGKQIITTTSNDMATAEKFVLAYIKGMEKAKTTDDLKAINKAYLSDDAAINTTVAGGDAATTSSSNAIFGGKTDAISTVASLPDTDNRITVYASSTDSKEIGFTAVYDVTAQKITTTKTYDIAK